MVRVESKVGCPWCPFEAKSLGGLSSHIWCKHGKSMIDYENARKEGKDRISRKFPHHMIVLSEMYWKIVDDLVKNNFPESSAKGIADWFFKNFKPLSRDDLESVAWRWE